jgi:threonine dehydratase
MRPASIDSARIVAELSAVRDEKTEEKLSKLLTRMRIPLPDFRHPLPHEIESAEATIRPYVRRTPVLTLAASDLALAAGRPPFRDLSLKLELTQHAGSFKARGAFANLLLRHVPEAGVVAASGGNHGVAVAYAARRLRRPATIFVPSVAAPAKVQRIRDDGAELVIAGDRYADSLEASEAFAERTGAMTIHAYDAMETLLGTGTLGVEYERQDPDVETLLVAVGGGGLLGGLAAWFRGRVRLIGVEPESAPTLTYALRAGRPVDAPAGGIAADSLAPKQVGQLMFPLAQRFVDRVLLVTDDEIVRAQRLLWSIARIVAEPGGAAAFAALISGRYRPRRTERVGVVVCGGNTDPGSVVDRADP